VLVRIVGERGTDLHLRGDRLTLLALLDNARTAVVLLEEADG
jgi:hypothetical protein